MGLTRPRTLREEMIRLFDELDRDIFAPVLTRGDGPETTLTRWMPAMDVWEDEGNVYVKASVPGIEPKDINVEVEGHTLTLNGETVQKEETHDKNYHRREIVKGQFYRQVRLPVEVQADKAQATFDKGMVIVTLPKAANGKRQKIQVQ